MPPQARVTAAILAAVTVVHLATQLTGAPGLLGAATQALLMSLLALTLWLVVRPVSTRLVVGTLVALFFSSMGDVAPNLFHDDLAFLVMVGFFLLAQVAYAVTFWPHRRRSVAGRAPWLLLPYAVALVGLLLACREGAGALFVPVVVYGLAITTMAVLATGLSRLAGLGGAVFMLSDALIALDAFTSWQLPVHGFWVMLTYVVGQTLLVTAVARAVRSAPAS